MSAGATPPPFELGGLAVACTVSSLAGVLELLEVVVRRRLGAEPLETGIVTPLKLLLSTTACPT
jgi:hypothetical protein